MHDKHLDAQPTWWAWLGISWLGSWFLALFSLGTRSKTVSLRLLFRAVSSLGHVSLRSLFRDNLILVSLLVIS